eukprot:m.242540 g.242540  ORF g.242540 m.242540 type:complete len:284 (-) comp17455_c1_seq43:35-886(-)
MTKLLAIFAVLVTFAAFAIADDCKPQWSYCDCQPWEVKVAKTNKRGCLACKCEAATTSDPTTLPSASTPDALVLTPLNAGAFFNAEVNVKKCHTLKASNKGFYMQSTHEDGVALESCKLGGGCGCNALVPCKTVSETDTCMAVFECKDQAKNKRCFKVRGCDRKLVQMTDSILKTPCGCGIEVEATVQETFNLDISECGLDLTALRHSAFNKLAASFKKKASKCIEACNVYSDRRRDITIVDANSFNITASQSHDLEELADCLVGNANIRGCPVVSVGLELLE